MTGLALLRRLPLLGLLLIAVPDGSPGQEIGGIAPASRESDVQVEFFEKEVRPVLVGRCFKCHSAEAKRDPGEPPTGLAPGLLKGGDLGPAVVPGDPDGVPSSRPSGTGTPI